MKNLYMDFSTKNRENMVKIHSNFFATAFCAAFLLIVSLGAFGQTITINDVTEVNAYEVLIGGTTSGITEGTLLTAYYGTTNVESSFSIGNTGETNGGSFQINVSALQPNITYYFQVRDDAEGITSNIYEFQTTGTGTGTVTIITNAASNVTSSGATMYATITGYAEVMISTNGFIYATSESELQQIEQQISIDHIFPDGHISVTPTSDGTLTAPIDYLSSNTTYYYKAYIVYTDSEQHYRFSDNYESFTTLDNGTNTGGSISWVTIGENGTTNINQYLPTYSYSYYSLSQQIYTASEIGQSGTIQKIAFYNSNPEQSRTIDLYLISTDKQVFTSTNDWEYVSSSNLVFSGEVSFILGDWTEIALNTPFEYDGQSNLIVVVDDNTSIPSDGLNFLVFDAASQSIYAYNDGIDIDPTNLGTTSANSIEVVKNQIKLGFGGSSSNTQTDDVLFHCDFEDTEQNSLWSLNNSSQTNYWHIGSAVSNGGSNALYITNDGGGSHQYDNTATSYSYATIQVWIGEADTYQFDFDWMSNGENDYDNMRAFLVSLEAVSSFVDGSTYGMEGSTNTTPAGWIDLYSQSGIMVGQTSWQHNSMSVALEEGGYNLVFFWKNDSGDGNNPPAAVDNIVVRRETQTATNQTGSFTDTRDGRSYDYVVIGEQTWMAENLRYDNSGSMTVALSGETSTTDPYLYYPDGESANLETYGYLYNWPAAMNGESSSDTNPSGVQGICPEGWHLPSNAEWEQLYQALGLYVTTPVERAGAMLAGNANLWQAGNLIESADFGTSGFNALPAGLSFNGTWAGLGSSTDFWTTKDENSENAYFYAIYSSESSMTLDYGPKSGGYSVRCIKDAVNTASYQTGSFTDTRDGRSYDYVVIGEQTWMAENLRYDNSGSMTVALSNEQSETDPYLYYPNGDSQNLETYGYLYNWPAAMNGAESSDANPSGVQGICPDGWHLPSNAEWTQLVETLGDEANAGAMLAGNASIWTAGTLTESEYFGTSSFNALPSGYYYPGDYGGFGTTTSFWTTTEDNESNTRAHLRGVDNSGTSLSRSRGSKTYGFSVRCVKDAETVADGPSDPTGTHNNHGYVDLGLPSGTMWANVNVGASNPSDYGNYYSWGGTTPPDSYESYDWSHYNLCDGSSATLNKYCTNGDYGTVDNLTTLSISDDAASVNWGGEWRMPTSAEYQELIDNCTWEWSEQDGKEGYLVRGDNGNSIFLPATGYLDSSGEHSIGYDGNYWSSSLREEFPSYAWNILFYSGSKEMFYQHERPEGLAIRPVYAPSNTASNETGTFIDDRDGRTYSYVIIGDQTWMAENLRYDNSGSMTVALSNEESDTDPYLYYPNGLSENLETYGYLYNWPAAMSSESSSDANPSGVQGICPTGWHLPSNAEWTHLTDYLGGTENAGAILAGNVGAVDWYGMISESADFGTSGFNAIAAGGYIGSFLEFGSYAFFWTATENSSSEAYSRNINNVSTSLYTNSEDKNYAYSVRCVKNAETVADGPSDPTGTHNNHGYVDLGLPSGTMWANVNVGATDPEGYGNYYAWGETTTKETYDWETYIYANGTTDDDPKLTKYCDNANYGNDGFTDTLTTLDATDDAAIANWGGDWRMPTQDEFQELYDNCDTTWMEINGMYGYLLTGPNGNSIFLPAAGISNETGSGGSDYLGAYWSSTYATSVLSYVLTFNTYEEDYKVVYVRRYYGGSVRPVYAPQTASTTLDPTAIHNDHGYVDLGLSVKWATTNIGATNIEEAGNYYAWGEIEPKATYEWMTYQYCLEDGELLTRYCNNASYGANGYTDEYTTLLPEDDVATSQWGSGWRMPTKAEMEELISDCTWEWTTQNGINGYIVKNVSTGYAMFLPVAGTYDDSRLTESTTGGYYWTSSLSESLPSRAWRLRFYEDSYNDVYTNDRIYGNSVRAVFDGTLAKPTVNIINRNVTPYTATLYAGVAYEEDVPVATEFGFMYGTDSTNLTSVEGEGEYTYFNKQITGLQPNTKYYWKVYATNVNGTAYSPLSFFTTSQVPATLPYTCDFEGTNESSNWSIENSEVASNNWYFGEAVAKDGERSLYISSDEGVSNTYDNTVETRVYLYRTIEIPENSVYEVKFDWRANGESNFDYLRAFLVPESESYSLSQGFTADFTPNYWIDVYEEGGQMNQADSWQTSTKQTTLESGNYNLVFLWANDYARGENPPAAIDNIEISSVACPAVADIIASSITTTTATINWAEQGSATNWNVIVADEEVADPDNYANVEATSATEYYAEGLNHSTLYYVYVQAECNADEKSSWRSYTFKTIGKPDVTTLYPVSRTTTDAMLKGKAISSDNTGDVQFAFYYGTSRTSLSLAGGSPTVTDSIATISISDLAPETQYWYVAEATNSYGSSRGDTVSFYTYGTITDDRDGQVYNTIQIGDQTWMAENLRFANDIQIGTDTSSTVACRYYPNGDEANVQIYGYLYNWKAAMNGASSSEANPSGVQGICPDGWHLPSNSEWTQLTTYIGGEDNAGSQLSGQAELWREEYYTYPQNTDSELFGSTGFNALPTGVYYIDYYVFNDEAAFWTSTEYTAKNAYSRYIYGRYLYARTNDNEKVNGYGVRCVKNVVTVATNSATNVTPASAILHGSILNAGNSEITARGFMFGTDSTSLTQNLTSTDNTADFTYTLSDLTANTTYYFKAYATIEGETKYGEVQFFRTPTGQHGEYYYVDLGLPSGTMWATTNVGASNPEDYGNYYAWGETTTKNEYTEDNYTYSDNPTTLPSEADAVAVNWGGEWITPTVDDLEELKNNCTSEWTSINGVYGRVFTAQNGNSIFMPAAGRFTSTLGSAGTYGDYWSSSLYTDNTVNASYIYFNSTYTNATVSNSVRYYGYTVRGIYRTVPTVATLSATDVSSTSAVLHGRISSIGNSEITARGFNFGTSSNNLTETFTSTDNTDEFSYTVSDLEAGRTYYFRAFATNSDGTSYGEIKNFVIPSGQNAGHDYIDLGLPSGIMWATCNVGATSPEDEGNRYAWGETTTKDTYTQDNYTYSDNPERLPADNDVAAVVWGGGWHTPTSADFEELVNNCTSEYTTLNDVNGYVFTGPNGNSIFIPRNYYWSSSIDVSTQTSAYALSLMGTGITVRSSNRYYGDYIRGVYSVPEVTLSYPVWRDSVSVSLKAKYTVNGTVQSYKYYTGSTKNSITEVTEGVTISSDEHLLTVNVYDLSPRTEYWAMAEIVDEYGTFRSDTLSFYTYGSFVDSRNNTTYYTIQIGEQTWMAENLKYAGQGVSLGTTTSDTEPYYYYPNGNEANVTTYGYLYNWPAAMNGASSSNENPSGVQGICPDGWHLPSRAEWTELENYLNSDHSGAMLAGQADLWGNDVLTQSSYFGATGFNAIPAGWVKGSNYNGGSNQKPDAFFWSSYAWDSGERATSADVYRDRLHLRNDGSGQEISTGYSVRCIKNLPPTVATLYPDTRTNTSATLKAKSFSGNMAGINYTFYYGESPTNMSEITNASPTVNGNVATILLSGLSPETQYYYAAEITSEFGTTRGDTLSFLTYGSFTDDRDGTNYYTIKIGEQTWMAENLRFTGDIQLGTQDTDTSSTVAYRYYPYNDEAYMDAYGYLYNRSAAMNGASSSSANPSGVQGLCPNGWHIPSDAEWVQMFNIFGGIDNAGPALSGSSNYWDSGRLVESENFGASGFNALPAGLRTPTAFISNTYYADFWTSNAQGNNGYDYFIHNSGTRVQKANVEFAYSCSVRCIRDITCPAVADLNVRDITDESATISWTEQGSAESWEVIVSERELTDVELYSYTSAATVNSQTYEATDLSLGTTYHAYVRAVCSTNDKSIWVSKNFVKGDAPIAFPYSCDFDDAEENAKWTIANGTQTNQWHIGTATNNGGDNSLYISNDDGTSNEYGVSATSYVYAYRNMNIAEDGSYMISFDWMAQGEGNFDLLRAFITPTSAVLEAGNANGMTSSNNTTPSGWTDIANPEGKLNLKSEWQQSEKEIYLEAGTYNLVFFWKNDNSQGTQPPAAIDNVSITKISCSSVANITVSEITTESASISWTERGSAENWEIIVSNTALDETQLESYADIGTATSTTYSATGLSPATTYYVYVRAACSSDEKSSWTSTTFISEQNSVSLPYTCDFENVDENQNWALINGDQTNKWYIGAAASNGGSNGLYVTNDLGTSNAYTNNVVSYIYAYRTIEFSESDTYNISFDWKAQGENNYDLLRAFLVPTSAVLEAGNANGMTSSNNTTPSGWTDIANPEGQLDIASEWQQSSKETYIDAGTYNLVFFWKNDVSGGTQPPAAIDNVSVKKVSCLSVTNIRTSSITTSSAYINWHESANASIWEVIVSDTKLDATALENYTDATVVYDSSYNAAGLSSGTKYYAYIRAVCSDSDKSIWQNIIFKTSCSSIIVSAENPYSEDFNSYSGNSTGTSTPTGYPNHTMPDCWEFANMSETSSTYPQIFLSSSSTYAVSGNCLFFKSSNTKPAYAILPPFSNSIENLSLEFTYKNEGTNTSNGTLHVGIANDISDLDASYVDVKSFEKTATNTTEVVNFATETDLTGEYYIVFKYVGSTNNYNLSIDDVSVRFLSSDAEITAFTFAEDVEIANINSDAATITSVVSYSTASLDGLVPTITVSSGASVSPESGVAQDFTSPVTYIVTAENSTTKEWTVSVSKAAGASSANSILSFTFDGQLGESVIDADSHTVTAYAEWYCDISNIIPAITVSPQATINPESGVAQDFTNPVSYTVTAEDVSSQTWTVTVLPDPNACPNPEQITVSNIADQTATISWQQRYLETSYNVKVSSTEMSDMTATADIYDNVISSTTLDLTGLTRERTYYVYVQSACGNDEGWVSTTFTTIITPATIPYTCDFEEITENNDWKLVNGDQTNKWYIGTAANNGGDNGLYISNDDGASNAYTLNTTSYVYAYRNFNIAEDGVYTVSFDWMAYGEGNYDLLRTFIVPTSVTLEASNANGMTSGTNTTPDGWTDIANPEGKLNNISEWQQSEKEMYLEAGTYNLVFFWKNDNSQGNQPPAAIDNVSVTKVSCPSVTSIYAIGITKDAATIGWTERGEAASWEVVVSETSLNETALATYDPIATVNDSSYSATGLRSLTTYHVYVRAACSGDEKSLWDSTTFRTIGMKTLYPDTRTNTTATLKAKAISDEEVNFTFYYGTSRNNLTAITNATPTITDSIATILLSGLSPETQYYYTAEATSNFGTLRGDTLSFLTYGQITDDRDGNQYYTIQIGDKTWLAQHLRFVGDIQLGASEDTSSFVGYRYYPNGDEANVQTYGYLYNWTAAMNGASGESDYTNPGRVQGICPNGWHLPSYAEWNQLANGLGHIDVGAQLAGQASLWDAGLLTSSELFGSTGFGALPAGEYYIYSSSFGNGAGFWNTSDNGASARSYLVYSSYTELRHRGFERKRIGYSIRCVKGLLTYAYDTVKYCGESYAYHDTIITASGDYIRHIHTANDLDTTYHLHLTLYPTLTATISYSNGCHGANNGFVEVTATGGSNSYTYLWNTTDQQTSARLENLEAGEYVVNVTDAVGCSVTASQTLTEPDELTASLTAGEIACNGGNTNISSTVEGGTPTYSYSWGGGETSQNLSNVAAGTYNVTVTDANSCSATASVTISQPEVLTASLTATEIACNGGTANITNTVSGGTPTYTYSWTGGATSQNLSGVSAGTYNVTVTDVNSCSATASVTISQPDELTVSLTAGEIACNGGNTNISSTVEGGTPTYSYSWGGGETSQNLSNVTAGTYNVTVTDANSCSATASVTISEPTLLTVSLSATEIACNGGTASITSSISGGTPTYTYSWSTGAASQNLTNVTAGNYSVTVTDANLCTATASITISEPTLLTASLTATEIACNGGTANITNTVSGGTPTYSYSWTGGATSQNLTGVTAGTYNVTVTDAHSCSATASVTINEPEELTASLSAGEIACNGGNTNISSTVEGGTTPYTYIWSNGSSAQDVSNVTAGTYSVTVRDVNGCSVTTSVSIEQPNVLTTSLSATAISCNGGTSDITNTISGGTGPYTYTWTPSASTQNLTGISAGTYSVTVTDSHECTATSSVEITQPEALTSVLSAGSVACNGGTASITNAVSGGTTPYTFAWDNGSNTQDLSGVTAGTYAVTVSDNRGCSVTATAEITQPEILTITLNAGTIACNGGTTTISSTVEGGTEPYQYAWSTDATTDNLTNAVAGTYSVTITDANTCSTNAVTTITQPDELLVTISGSTSVCEGTSTRLTANVSGGTSGYTYAWSSGETSEEITTTNITAATPYSVTVSDANSCSATASVSVSVGTTPGVEIVAEPSACFGNNIVLQANVSNAGTNYTLTWSATPADDAGLTTTEGDRITVTPTAEGSYTYTASLTTTSCSDDEPFNSSAETTIAVNPLPDVAITNNTGTSELTCNTETISLTATGGTIYAWSSGATTEQISLTTSGNYSVTVTDANTCSNTASIEITQNVTSPTVSISNTSVTSILTCSLTSINVEASGDGESYQWSGGASPSTAENTLSTEGTYTVTATADNGCTSTASILISEDVTPPTLSITNTTGTTELTCERTSINVGVTGTGTSYRWSDGESPNTASNTLSAAGTYTVTATGENGCTSTADITITQNVDLPNVVATASDSSICLGSSTTLTATGAESYQWSPITNLSISIGNEVVATPTETTTYTVTATAENGCTLTAVVPIVVNTTVENEVALTTCESYDWNGTTYTETGDFTQTFAAANGCDSVVTLHLTINNAVTNEISDTACGSYQWNDSTYYASGEYIQTFYTREGCDSIVTLNLTINQPTESNDTVTVCGSYEWNGTTYTESGNYQFTLPNANANGCDSIANLFLTINQPLTESVEVTACDSYQWNDSTYYASGDYEQTFIAVNGCDSVVTLHLTINNSTTSEVSAQMCSGVPYVYEGQTFTEAGTYEVTLVNANGCDSIVTLTITYANNCSGIVSGIVTDENTDEPIPNARVTVGNKVTRTNAEGEYSLEVLRGRKALRVSAPGFISYSRTVDIQSDTIFNASLKSPRIETDVDSLTVSSYPYLEHSDTITLSNTGSGTLIWSSITEYDNLALVEDSVIQQRSNTRSLWDSIQTFATRENAEQAIATDGFFIYTSSWMRPGEFNRYTPNGEYVETFYVENVGAIRNLSYDGTNFYGTEGTNIIFKLDLDNQTLVDSIETDIQEIRHCSFNRQDGSLLAGSWNSLYRIDTASGVAQQIRSDLANVYSSAFDNLSPGGPYLWLFSQTSQNNGPSACIRQFDISTGEYTNKTHYLDDINLNSTSLAGGICASEYVCEGKFVLLADVQNPTGSNTIATYEIGRTNSVVRTDKKSGSIEPNESENIFVRANATETGDYSATIKYRAAVMGQQSRDVNLSFSAVAPECDAVQQISIVTDTFHTVTLDWQPVELGEYESVSYLVFNTASQFAIDTVSGTTVTYDGLPAGSHCFTVCALSQAGYTCLSAASDTVCAEIQDIPCNIPLVVEARSDGESITVSWNMPVGVDYVSLYRYSDPIDEHLTTTSYVDTNVVPETDYCYIVIAHFENGVCSEITGNACIRIAANVCTEAPVLTADAVNGTVALEWTESNGAVNYKVFRNNTFVGATSGTTYVDNVSESGEYCYRVESICEYGMFASSDEVCLSVEIVEDDGSGSGEGGGEGGGEGDAIDEWSADNLTLYPNPTYGQFFIEGQRIAVVQIFNASGMLVSEIENTDSDRITINCESWNPGLYNVRIISTEGETATRKVTIFR